MPKLVLSRTLVALVALLPAAIPAAPIRATPIAVPFRSAPSAVQEPLPILPLSQISAGMRGVGYTVIAGSQPQEFSVEILGVLYDAFPKHDLIVARLTGLGLERSGVVAGMSGSPVLVQGQMIGAVAYRLVSFGHEAIAGIVPIEQMLAIHDSGEPSATASRAVPGQIDQVLAAAASSLTGGARVAPPAFGGLAAAAGIEPIATPLTLAGFRPEIVRRVAPVLAQLGFETMAGGVEGEASTVTPNLVPGGALAVQLMRGDVNVTASGTISYRDGDRILAFGHPFLQGGKVDFPLVASEVITVLSSAASSSKLSVSGHEVLGAIRQDRLAGILGIVGARPDLVPVRVRIHDTQGGDEELHMELVADKILTPLYLFLGIVNGVQSLHQVYGEGSVELDAEIRLTNEPESVRFGNLFSSQNQAIIGLSSSLAGLFGSLYDNAFGPVHISDVDVGVSLRPDRRSATIERVWYDHSEVTPGESLRVVVTLKPYRAPVVVERLQVEIPVDLSPGPVTLLIGSGDVIAHEEASFAQGALQPRTLGQLVQVLNQARRSDRLYVQLSRAAAGVLIDGRLMPALPPSVLGVLGSERSAGDIVPVRRTVVMETSQPVSYVVSGSYKFQLQVRAH